MKIYRAVLMTLTLLLSHQTLAYTLYEDPIHIQNYVTDPASAVKAGMQQYGWSVETEADNSLIAKLDYKDYKIRVAINYDASTINITSLSQERTNCVVTKREKCEVNQSYIDRWRSNLRRGITKAIHDLAVADAYAKLAAEE